MKMEAGLNDLGQGRLAGGRRSPEYPDPPELWAGWCAGRGDGGDPEEAERLGTESDTAL